MLYTVRPPAQGPLITVRALHEGEDGPVGRGTLAEVMHADPRGLYVTGKGEQDGLLWLRLVVYSPDHCVCGWRWFIRSN